MKKVACPTCRREYWDCEKAIQCCQLRRDREDAETEFKKYQAERRLVRAAADHAISAITNKP